MTKLIPLDAAIAEIEKWWNCSQSTWQSPMTILRAIPSIDPAAIRDEALSEAADSLRGMADFCKLMGDLAGATALYSAATALIGEKK